MPAQKTTSAQKTSEWGRLCVDAIIGMASSSTFRNGRTSKQNKQVNYDLYNSKHDDADFDYVVNPYGQTRRANEKPSQIQNYNIIRTNIEVLKGEEIKRPFNFFARAIAGGADKAKEQVKRNLILQHLETRLMQEMGQEVDPDEASQMSLPDIEKYMKSQYVDPRETTANQLIKYLLKQEKLEMKFNQGWEHALIAAEEIYYIGIVSGEPKVRVVNPLDFEFDKEEGQLFIEDSQWAREERFMSKGAVLDTYGEFLSDKELDLIDSDQVGSGLGGYGMQHPGFAMSEEDFRYNSSINRNQSGIQVVNVCWKSWKKIGFVRVLNPETGEEMEQMVEDDFKMPAELKPFNPTIEWRWINEVWEGTRIGRDIYVNIRPLANQTRSMSNPSECKLPYTGYIYNNTNSQATSLLDLVKPHQYTYTIVWWRLEQELAKAKGKAFVMDMAQLPKSQGMSVDEWINYFDNVGVAFINSMEEGREGDPNTVSKFNQFQSIDRSLSQVVGQYMEVLNKLEQQVDNLTGVSPQRRADTSPSETATGVQNAIVQSSHITEPYFYYHNIVKGQVLTKLLECAKIAYEGNKKINYIVDEVYQEVINIDGEIFSDSDYGVFVSNSSKDYATKEKMLQLASIAMQNDKLTMTDYMTILDEDSISAIRGKVSESEEDIKRQAQESAQADRDNQSQIADKQIQDAQAARENDNMNKQLDRENKIQVATLNTLRGKDGPSDINANGIPDAIEQSKIQLEMSKHEADKVDKQTKQGLEMQKANMQMKQAQDKNAVEIEKLKAENARFEREQAQQDNLNNVKVQTDIHKSKLEEAKLMADIAKTKQDSKDKELDRKFKLKELDAKMTLERFKANEKIKSDRLKTQADIAAKKMKTKADIAAKKASIKTKPKSK